MNRNALSLLRAAIVAGGLMVIGGGIAAAAALPQEEQAAQEAEKAEAQPAEKPEAKTEERYLVLKGGDVYTVTGPVLRGATILAKDGVIADIGREVEIPEGAEVLDVTGLKVYPGLVAVFSSGILGSDPPEDSTDVYGLGLTLGLSAGLTTVNTGNTAAKLTYGTLEGMVVERNLFTSLSYERRRPNARRELREDLEKVRQYLRDVTAFERKKAAGDKDVAEPDKKWIKGKYDTYLKLLQGEVTALISANDTQDLRDAADLAGHFGFRLVINGGMEAWTMAPELGRKGVALIVSPRRKSTRGSPYEGDDRDATPEAAELAALREALTWHEGGDEHDEDPLASWEDRRLLRSTGWSIENCRILHDSGVAFAIIPESPTYSLGGITGRDLSTMPMEAAFAVRGGLPEQAALEAITIGAARVLGVDDRVGSIEVGKDADLIVVDGDLLHYRTMVQWTVVNGRIVYDKEKESLFAHIRPRGKPGTEPRPELWPRELGPMPSFEPRELPPAPGEEPQPEAQEEGEEPPPGRKNDIAS